MRTSNKINSKAEKQENVTIIWFVADSSYSKIWNPEKNV